MQGEQPSDKDAKSRRRYFERSDEAILDQLKRSRRAAGSMLLGLLICFVASAVAVFMGRVGVLPLPVGEYFGATTLIVWFLAAVFWFGQRMVPAPEANEERILRKRIDSFQSLWRVMTLFMVFFAFTTTLSVSSGLERLHASYPPLAVFAGATLAFVILLYSLAVFYGPGYLGGGFRIVNDELARALHARAFKAGYLALMAMVAGVVPAILYKPALTLPALCWVLFAGFALPTLYYVILQWRAGSGG